MGKTRRKLGNQTYDRLGKQIMLTYSKLHRPDMYLNTQGLYYVLTCMSARRKRSRAKKAVIVFGSMDELFLDPCSAASLSSSSERAVAIWALVSGTAIARLKECGRKSSS